MRYLVHLRLAAVASVALAAACGEPTTAPATSRMPKGAPSLDVIVDAMSVDSTAADFTVTPSGGLFTMGPHAVFFPANSICDPATSSYGPDQWDAPCEPAAEPVQIHAEVRRAPDGSEYVDFTPNLRFAPTEDSNNYVWILMKVAAAQNTADPSRFPILYAPHLGAEGIDEAASDPTQVTYVHVPSGVVFRRIKHFSGYAVDVSRFSFESEDVIALW
ncbi:MAG TPA: hypothetical protein VNA89_10360 [Gemmatimonadaceae bacterium]|nr:hypothetical protein [Gemmatimonadaceae bacterium]